MKHTQTLATNINSTLWTNITHTRFNVYLPAHNAGTQCRHCQETWTAHSFTNIDHTQKLLTNMNHTQKLSTNMNLTLLTNTNHTQFNKYEAHRTEALVVMRHNHQPHSMQAPHNTNHTQWRHHTTWTQHKHTTWTTHNAGTCRYPTQAPRERCYERCTACKGWYCVFLFLFFSVSCVFLVSFFFVGIVWVFFNSTLPPRERCYES